tara:strand:- start:28 stop:216 length:189 start_codon:yes stop_codon:yes gene_type:complete
VCNFADKTRVLAEAQAPDFAVHSDQTLILLLFLMHTPKVHCKKSTGNNSPRSRHFGFNHVYY